MAPPTLTSQTSSTWTDTVTTSEVTGTLSWNSGDRILVLGVTEDKGLAISTPTATGLTFAPIGSALIAAGNSAWAHAWEATAGAASSGVVNAAVNAGSGMRGIWASAWGGCTGFVRTSGTAGQAGQSVSVTRTAADSGIAYVGADWTASGIGGLGWTPAGQTQVQAVAHANVTAFAAYWGGQGAAGTTSYGTSGLAGNNWTQIAIEILGTAGSSDPPKPPRLVMPSFSAHRRANY